MRRLAREAEGSKVHANSEEPRRRHPNFSGIGWRLYASCTIQAMQPWIKDWAPKDFSGEIALRQMGELLERLHAMIELCESVGDDMIGCHDDKSKHLECQRVWRA